MSRFVNSASLVHGSPYISTFHDTYTYIRKLEESCRNSMYITYCTALARYTGETNIDDAILCFPHLQKSAWLGNLLCFQALLPFAFDVSCKPQRRKKEKSNTRADCTSVIWPCSAQEARVLVMSRWDDGDGCR